MPRWLTIVTFAVGVGFLLFAGVLREARFLFPSWVPLVSVCILVVNYRLAREQKSEEEMSMDSGS